MLPEYSSTVVSRGMPSSALMALWRACGKMEFVSTQFGKRNLLWPSMPLSASLSIMRGEMVETISNLFSRSFSSPITRDFIDFPRIIPMSNAASSSKSWT